MDKATFSQISRATQELYGFCVARDTQRSEGGWISGLGRLDQFVSPFCFGICPDQEAVSICYYNNIEISEAL